MKQPQPTVPYQSLIGLSLAAAIIAAWLVTHIGSVFFYTWGWHSIVSAPLLVAFSCWLYVGLFIIAHDCMHGSLAPGRPSWNRYVGRLCLFLYAGFDFSRLNSKHHEHHEHSGTEKDPDFFTRPPRTLGRWYLNFFMEYFSWPQVVYVFALSMIYLFWVGAPLANVLVFWALPAIVSSLQLFYFGTYLPHRPSTEPFADAHRARTNNFSWWLSLFTCYHFGYHHEHHQYPYLPWWRLPSAHQPM